MTEEVQAQEAAPVEAPKWAAETEQEAKALGWKPPDEWKGDIPPGYIDNPEKYLERAESFTPFRKLREKLTETERKTEERLAKIESVAAKAVERRLAEIQQAQLAAVETGDVETFKSLRSQEAALVEQKAPAQTAVPPDHKVAIDLWVAGKDWFRTDPVMTQAAVTYYGEAQGKGMTDPAAILSYVDKQMEKKFRVDPPAEQMTASQAVTPGLSFGAPTADAFSKLPKDAQETFKRFVAKGLFKDDKAGRAAYVEDYNDA